VREPRSHIKSFLAHIIRDERSPYYNVANAQGPYRFFRNNLDLFSNPQSRYLLGSHLKFVPPNTFKKIVASLQIINGYDLTIPLCEQDSFLNFLSQINQIKNPLREHLNPTMNIESKEAELDGVVQFLNSHLELWDQDHILYTLALEKYSDWVGNVSTSGDLPSELVVQTENRRLSNAFPFSLWSGHEFVESYTDETAEVKKVAWVVQKEAVICLLLEGGHSEAVTVKIRVPATNVDLTKLKIFFSGESIPYDIKREESGQDLYILFGVKPNDSGKIKVVIRTPGMDVPIPPAFLSWSGKIKYFGISDIEYNLGSVRGG
jgi:hypothetical protein